MPEYFEVPTNPDGPNNFPDRQFMRNPMYRHKDPIQSIIKSGDYGNGIPIFMRNPLARPGGNEFSNTYQKMTQGNKIIMPEVDPWYE